MPGHVYKAGSKTLCIIIIIVVISNMCYSEVNPRRFWWHLMLTFTSRATLVFWLNTPAMQQRLYLNFFTSYSVLVHTFSLVLVIVFMNKFYSF